MEWIILKVLQGKRKRKKCKRLIIIIFREIKKKVQESAVVLKLDNKDPILYSDNSLKQLDTNNTLRYEVSIRHFKNDINETQKEWIMQFKKYK